MSGNVPRRRVIYFEEDKEVYTYELATLEPELVGQLVAEDYTPQDEKVLANIRNKKAKKKVNFG